MLVNAVLAKRYQCDNVFIGGQNGVRAEWFNAVLTLDAPILANAISLILPPSRLTPDVVNDAYATYKKYSDAVNRMAPVSLRDLMDFSPMQDSVPLEYVSVCDPVSFEVQLAAIGADTEACTLDSSLLQPVVAVALNREVR